MKQKLVFAVLAMLLSVFDARLAFAQKVDIQTELKRERFIRIVEPLVYQATRLHGENRYNLDVWVALDELCSAPYNNPAYWTELGKTDVDCEISPAPVRSHHGGIPLMYTYGNRVIKITVRGYKVKEPLCFRTDIAAGWVDLGGVKRCDQKDNVPEVFPVVVAELNIITKVEFYTQEEADKLNRARNSSGVIISPTPSDWEEGDVKFQEIAVSGVKYRFPNNTR